MRPTGIFLLLLNARVFPRRASETRKIRIDELPSASQTRKLRSGIISPRGAVFETQWDSFGPEPKL